jgi:hypothetical protein
MRNAGSLSAGRKLGAAAAVMAALAASEACADWFFDAAAGLEYDDNLPRAQRDADIEEDFAFAASVAPGQYFQLTDRVGLSLTANLTGALYDEFTGLNHYSGGLTAALRTKLGLGPEAPWLRIAGSAAWYDFNHEARDGLRTGVSVTAGRRIGSRWDLQAGWSYERRRSDEVIDIPFLVTNFGIHGDAYDTDAHSLSLGSVYALTDRLALVAGYTRRIGEVTATTRISGDIFAASDAISPDPVFGPDRFAYRIEAESNIYSVALSWALGNHASINAGYEYQDTDGRGDLTYKNNVARISLLYSY